MDTEAPVLGEHKVNYHITTDHFEGPLDLLLSLIEKRKLFIGDFALAKVADEYIAHVRKFEEFPTSDVANFLLVASTLVLIKSKSILPELDLSKEEVSDIDDLKRRLAMYELYRALAGEIKEKYGKTLIYERGGRPETVTVFAPDAALTPERMRLAIESVIGALPKKTVVPKAVVKKVISIEEMMTRLATRVTQALRMSFGQFANYKKGAVMDREERVGVIVSFLAMLELVKQGVVHVAQAEQHGDIDIETHEFGTPEYS